MLKIKMKDDAKALNTAMNEFKTRMKDTSKIEDNRFMFKKIVKDTKEVQDYYTDKSDNKYCPFKNLIKK